MKLFNTSHAKRDSFQKSLIYSFSLGMVQKRGRARAKDSSYANIAEATSTSKVREERNLIHEAMMLEAVSEVQEMQIYRREDYDMKVRLIVISNALPIGV